MRKSFCLLLAIFMFQSCSMRPYPRNSMVVVDIKNSIDQYRSLFYQFEERMTRVFQTISSEKGDFQVSKGKAYQYYSKGNIYQVNISTKSLRLVRFSAQQSTFNDRRDALEKELKRLEADKKLAFGAQLAGSKLTTAVSISNVEIMKDLMSVAGPQISASARAKIKNVLDRHSTKAGIFIHINVQKAGKKALWRFKGWLPTYFFCPTKEQDQVAFMLKRVEDLLTENVPFLRVE